MYGLILDLKAIKYLEKLPKIISKRIFIKLQETKINPYRYFIRLEGRNEYKLRIGDYRAIADINNKEILIYILKIDHRRRIYKK